MKLHACLKRSFLLLHVSDVSWLLGDGAEPVRLVGRAVQSGSGPATGRLAAGDVTDASVLLGGSRVLVWTQTAGERAGGGRPGLGSPHHVSDSVRPTGTFPV